MNGRRTQLLFRPAPGSERSGSGHGYIIMGGSGWTVTGVVRCGQSGRLDALAGWGPAEDFKTLSIPLSKVDAGGVWNLSGRGIGPPPGILWITRDHRLLLTAGALSSQEWRRQATLLAFPQPPEPAAAHSVRIELAEPETGVFPRQDSERAQEAPPGVAPVSTVGRPPLKRKREADTPPSHSAESAASVESADPPAPLPDTAAPGMIPDLMGIYPEETPFIGLLPGARFVRVPVESGQEYDHYIVGHIPIGEKGFYLVGVPGPAGWLPPAGLPQFVHYLPGRMGGGYWVRYMVPDGSWE